MPLGTRKFEISRSPVSAVIVTSPEMSVPAFVMNCFAPSMTQSPLSATARVVVFDASEPPSASVRPNAPRISPAHSRGSQSWRCCSVP